MNPEQFRMVFRSLPAEHKAFTLALLEELTRGKGDEVVDADEPKEDAA